MSTPDPQTARDFARRAILSSAEDVDFMGIAEQFSYDENWPADDVDAEAMHDAVEAERQTATVTVSWPDEQQPADPVSGEQQDGAVGGKGAVHAASLLAFLDLHRERRGHDVIAFLAVGDGSTIELTQVQLRAVLAEREADLRVMEMAITMLDAIEWYGDSRGDDVQSIVGSLNARFADRITAQAGDETDGSGTDDVPCFWCHCDGCDECTGIHGVACGCRNPVQR